MLQVAKWWRCKFDVGNIQNDDDASCQSSLSSYNSYNLTYCSDNEDYNHLRSFIRQDLQQGENTKNFTRLTTRGHRQNVRPDMTRHKNIKRGSVVDIRSQMLHRSLVEEIHKRRLSKTVAAIENIGYHEPTWWISVCGFVIIKAFRGNIQLNWRLYIKIKVWSLKLESLINLSDICTIYIYSV